MKATIVMLLVAGAALGARAQIAAQTEALTLRKELTDLQFSAANSAEGVARREALHRAERAYREALAKIPEFQALEAERAALREQLKALAQRQAALEAKYAAQLAPEKQARDAAMQQVQSDVSGGARGAAIKARLDVIAPVPAAR
jgi:hypothetical protein